MRQPLHKSSFIHFSHQRILIRNGFDDRLRLFDAGFLLLDDDGDSLSYAVEILSIKTSCGGGRGSEADSAGHERRSLLVGDRVLVSCDVCLVQELFRAFQPACR